MYLKLPYLLNSTSELPSGVFSDAPPVVIISNQLVTIRGMHPPRNVPSSHRMLIIVKELQASLTCTRTFYPIHCTGECMWDPVTMDGLRRIVTPPAVNALRDILLVRDVDRDI